MNDENRRYEGSNAQWLLKQNVYDILCKAQKRLDGNFWGESCILDVIFGEGVSPVYDGCSGICERCIEDFLYRQHKDN